MRKKSQYVFGAALAGVAMGMVPQIVERANASVITADFTFESSLSANSSSTQTVGPFLAEVGTGTAFGSHAATNTNWSVNAGNGSFNSLSVNNWATGDYFKFTVPTTGLTNILVSFDQISSSTGPKIFDLIASDGTNTTNAGSYSVLSTQTVTETANGTTTTATANSWHSGSSGSAYNVSFDLSADTTLNNNPNDVFEIVEADSGIASAGTDRVDNFVVAGTPVPEPAELSLLTVSAAALLFRRRKDSKPA